MELKLVHTILDAPSIHLSDFIISMAPIEHSSISSVLLKISFITPSYFLMCNYLYGSICCTFRMIVEQANHDYSTLRTAYSES